MTQQPEIIDLRIALHEAINALIKHKEEEFDHELPDEDKHFLLTTVADNALLRIHKYVAGNKEHGDGFLTDVDHIREAQKELADLDMYLAGALKKQLDFDKRYET